MGILDDAIRQHLDLKRQRGATESELKQLEDEAFGPPSRPGQPDFPDSGEAGQQSGNGNGSASGPEPSQVAETSADTGEADVATEPAIAEHPIVEGDPEAAEEAPGSEEPTTFFDQTAGDAEHDDTAGDEAAGEAEHDEPPSDQAPAPPEGDAVEATEPEVAAEPPVESLDTVEHPAPFDVIEDEAPVQGSEAEDEHPVDGEPDLAEDEGEAVEAGEVAEADDEDSDDDEENADDDEDSDDDVLADTPEFLRDAPEDDELWFEQGKPKDFDF
ncbi:MAG: hypothetical protein ACRDK1_01390 [Solirubrobacterales bacterium]